MRAVIIINVYPLFFFGGHFCAYGENKWTCTVQTKMSDWQEDLDLYISEQQHYEERLPQPDCIVVVFICIHLTAWQLRQKRNKSVKSGSVKESLRDVSKSGPFPLERWNLFFREIIEFHSDTCFNDRFYTSAYCNCQLVSLLRHLPFLHELSLRCSNTAIHLSVPFKISDLSNLHSVTTEVY